MKTFLRWSIITFIATNCLGQTRGTAISSQLSCTDHNNCPYNKACIFGNCENPCESLCGINTYCKTFHHIPACFCKEGYTGNAFIRCSLQGEVNTDTEDPQTQVPSKKSNKRCRLPSEQPKVKFCSTAVGCEGCDFNNNSCHVSSGTEMAVEAEVKVVCAPGYTVQTIDKAVCLSKGWFPSIPECQLDAVPHPVSLPKRCKIPNDSPDIKYCLMGEGCSDCDYNNTRCHLAPGTEVDKGVQVKEVCASDTIDQISTATCYSKGWNPPFPKCQYRCGVSKAVKSSAVTIEERLPAYPGYFPWHAGIYVLYKENNTTTWIYNCGGSLITNEFVLTAFFCVEKTELAQLQVSLGKYHQALEKEEPTANIFNVTEISYSPHEFTYKSSSKHEAAFLKLAEKVKFNEYMRPVCLYYGDDTNIPWKSNVFIVGLGNERQRPDKDVLDYKTLTLSRESECQKTIKEKQSPFLQVFCATNPGLFRPGDGGGSLTAVDENGLHYLLGYDIATLHYNGGVSLYGDTFSGKNRDWMESKINSNILK